MIKIVFMEANTLGTDVDLSAFSKIGEVVTYPLSDTALNAQRIKDADIIIVNKIMINEALLKDALNVKLICLTATGTNVVDFDYTNKRGIVVTNVKGYSTQSVVQHTFSLLFYLYEKLAYYDHFVKSGEYARNDVFSHFINEFHEINGKTWGIIGLGEIGRSVARVAEQFGCNVIYYSTSGANTNSAYKRVGLGELLQVSDIVSIHCPLNDRTRGLIGERELGLMKRAGILLNLGRGPIVDEAALYMALRDGVIGGAGLDVLAVEPMSPQNPLIAIQDSTKLIITPHIGWATVEARTRCAEEVRQNIEAWLEGKERNVVSE